jgi:hypothetical protein
VKRREFIAIVGMAGPATLLPAVPVVCSCGITKEVLRLRPSGEALLCRRCDRHRLRYVSDAAGSRCILSVVTSVTNKMDFYADRGLVPVPDRAT